MINLIRTLALTTLAFVLAFTLGNAARTAPTAPAITTYTAEGLSTMPLSARETVCNEFAVYQSHPTRRNLERVVTDSYRLGNGWLIADVGQLWADSVTVKPNPRYVSADIEYIRDDCQGAN